MGTIALANSASLFLVGPMGAGKSTVGRELARQLGVPFRDSDTRVEGNANAGIPELFAEHGETGFRDLEETAINELTASGGLILATGGGAVLRQANRQRLHDRGTVVYLTATVATQLERTRDSDRPLLKTADPGERLRQLLAERDPLYRATAHHVVATDGEPLAELVATILQTTGKQAIEHHD